MNAEYIIIRKLLIQTLPFELLGTDTAHWTKPDCKENRS